jgi:hypothetical protein
MIELISKPASTTSGLRLQELGEKSGVSAASVFAGEVSQNLEFRTRVGVFQQINDPKSVIAFA